MSKEIERRELTEEEWDTLTNGDQQAVEGVFRAISEQIQRGGLPPVISVHVLRAKRLDLRGMRLQGVAIKRCLFPSVDLGGADLRGADFRGAQLVHGKISFAGADLRGARMDVYTCNYSTTDFNRAKCDPELAEEIQDYGVSLLDLLRS